MITFDRLTFTGRQPAYVQLAEYVKRLILCGEARDGDALPSRREIAVQANLNPNTVQKAYRLMEEEGYVVTEGNHPSTVRVTPALYARIEEELTRGLCREFVEQARQNHLSYKKAISLISELWED